MKRTKKYFFSGPYFPNHDDNLMGDEGNVSKAREDFLSTRFNNLDFLLETRYKWMNKYLKEDMNMLEYSQKLSEMELNYKLFYNEIINKHTQLINLYYEIDYLNRIIQNKYIILY